LEEIKFFELTSKMQSGNRFLQDFIRSQSKLIHDAEAAAPVKKDKKGRKKSKNGTADGKPAFGELTLETLIAEKPGKKEVLEYFRDMITRLVADDMANA